MWTCLMYSFPSNLYRIVHTLRGRFRLCGTANAPLAILATLFWETPKKDETPAAGAPPSHKLASLYNTYTDRIHSNPYKLKSNKIYLTETAKHLVPLLSNPASKKD